MRVACLYFENPVDVERLAENCLRLSPQIAVRGKSAVFIEIGKCSRIYSEETFLLRTQVILRRLGFTGSVAIGDDLPQSLLKAKYKTSDPLSLPLSSLLDLADPFEKDLVIRKYVSKMIENFTDLGISTIAQFRNLPMRELSSRFGPVGILCHQRAQNQMSVQWPYWKPQEIIKEREDYLHWDYGGTLEPILFSIKTMLDQIFYRLYARGFHLQSLLVNVSSEVTSRHPVKTREFDFQFMFPQSATRGALTIIRERMNKDFQKNPIRTAVESLEVIVTSTVDGSAGQKSLLHDREERKEKLHSFLNQLRETYGQDSVYQTALTEDRRPEKSWRKLLGKADLAQLVEVKGKIPLRPTHLLKPEKVEVSAGMVFIRKSPKKILKWHMTFEKISGDWAEMIDEKFTGGFDRTYFTVEIEGGAKLSLFQTPEHDYFLHGYFG